MERDAPLWLRHLRENVCANDPALERYVLDWLAWVVQKPAEKPRVALLFSGPQGSGKNMLNPNAISITKT
jgi:pantothenate kinase-related protein Tda10